MITFVISVIFFFIGVYIGIDIEKKGYKKGYSDGVKYVNDILEESNRKARERQLEVLDGIKTTAKGTNSNERR